MSDSSTPSIVSSIPRTFTFQNLLEINSLWILGLEVPGFNSLLADFFWLSSRVREKESVQLNVNKYQRAGSKKTTLTQWALFRNNVNFWPAWAFDALWSANGRLSTFLLEESASAAVESEQRAKCGAKNLFRANLNWQRCSRSRTKHNCGVWTNVTFLSSISFYFFQISCRKKESRRTRFCSLEAQRLEDFHLHV